MIRELTFNDHDEWLAIRSKYIGGSDSGAVIGLNPYKSAYSLWAEKTGRVPGFEGNMATRVGSFLEEFVAKLFEEETGKKVRRKNRTMVNDLYPFACANVDRMIVGEKAILEIKTTTNYPLIKKLRNSEEFAEEYYSQCMHYLAVTGLEKAYLAVLINCRELKIFELERDQAEIDALMDAEAHFWDCVVNDTPPCVDGSKSTSETISTLYPYSSNTNVDLSGFEGELKQILEIKQQIKVLTDMKDEKENMIKEYMRDAATGESPNYKVSFKSQSRSNFKAKDFKKDHPEMDFTPYESVTEFRKFDVKEV